MCLLPTKGRFPCKKDGFSNRGGKYLVLLDGVAEPFLEKSAEGKKGERE